MSRDGFVLVTFIATALVSLQTLGNTDSTATGQPLIATVSYGRIIFEETELVAYRQNDDGLLVPTDDLTEKEIEKVSDLIRRVDAEIAYLVQEHGFSLVLRKDDHPSDMGFSIAALKWRPDLEQPIRVMTPEERKIKKRNHLFVELEKRVVAQRKIDITNLVLKRLRKK